jgi:hypothetical protein
MRAARLKELEEMAAQLLETARKLPSGQDRHNVLQEIERFRARITALQLSGMAQSPPYDLVTRPCTIHAGRFRWDIRENGRPIRSSTESFATEHEAHADGRHELEILIQVSRL